jgi:hypothetical protein
MVAPRLCFCPISPSMTTLNRVAIAMTVGFVLIVGVAIGILARVPDQILSTNYVRVTGPLGFFRERTIVCQANERLPASTEAVRMSLIAYLGSAVSLTVSHEGQILASGRHGAGWVSGSLTLPLRTPVAKTLDAKLCLTRGRGYLPVELAGDTAPRAHAATVDGNPLPGRMRIEYLARGHRSWLSLAKHVARRLGLGHSPSGAWIVLPLAAMMAIAVTLAAWLLLREQRYD